ncbi:hypothetical protein, partial [Acetobacter fallax]|uniref:hypothetical protein n=1 Tax=Acetobacter fallax TaxID=1737473 RepID=UPI001A7E5EA5
ASCIPIRSPIIRIALQPVTILNQQEAITARRSFSTQSYYIRHRVLSRLTIIFNYIIFIEYYFIIFQNKLSERDVLILNRQWISSLSEI